MVEEMKIKMLAIDAYVVSMYLDLINDLTDNEKYKKRRVNNE